MNPHDAARSLYVPPMVSRDDDIVADGTVRNGATFSRDRRYRYTLWRSWGDPLARAATLAVIGLNPSTADATSDDPTIHRCIKRAQALGYNSLVMVNLFAYRATDPKMMLAAGRPEGSENLRVLRWILTHEHVVHVLAAWGARGNYLRMSDALASEARAVDREMYCLGSTKHGEPVHPLYIPYSRQMVPYRRIVT